MTCRDRLLMNKNRNKILFVVPYNPLLGSKGAQGPKNVSEPLILLLSAVYEVVLIVVSDDLALTEAVLRAAFPAVREMHVCRPLSGRERWLARLRYALSCLPPSLADGDSRALPALLRRYAPTSDLVHFEYFTLAPSIALVPHGRSVQLHCHDAYSLYQKRYLEQASKVGQKIRALLRFLMFRHLEHRLFAKAAAALTVSPVDQRYLAAAGLKNVHYLPPAVRDVAVPIAPGRDAMPAELLCVVPASRHQFQEDALRDFFRDIYPALVRQFPGLRVTLFGKTARRLQAELRPYVDADAVDFVDDYFGFLGSKNWIYFYPLRAGAGLHTKVRDAMAARLPVIGYTEIMDAFQGVNWENYVACADPAAVGQAIAALVAEPTLHQRVGTGGQRLLAERFSPATVLDTWERVSKGIKQNEQ
jgi:glycosyltransferase involved in cell wall biosynthesis